MNSKLFLNMVIHDMRNPTNSIEFALKQSLKLLQSYPESHSEARFFNKKNSTVLQAVAEVHDDCSLGNYDSNLESFHPDAEKPSRPKNYSKFRPQLREE
jgi:hypothetical protein